MRHAARRSPVEQVGERARIVEGSWAGLPEALEQGEGSRARVRRLTAKKKGRRIWMDFNFAWRERSTAQLLGSHCTYEYLSVFLAFYTF
jgi:hypothetical protein